MFTPQVEPLGAGKWFHCKVLNILTSFLHCMVDQRIDHAKLLSIFVFAITLIVFNVISVVVFYKIACLKKRKTNCATTMAFNPWSILSLTIALDQSVWDTLFSYCKMLFRSQNYFCCFQLSTPHQWLEGNLPVSARCSVCDEVCGSKRRLQGFRCLWCNMMVSNGRLQRLTFQHSRGCLKKKKT